jgi:glycosyltransferase involved in cell wall biosynthesis
MKICLLSFALLAVSALCAAENNFKPRVSLITSMYNGDEHIREFLEDVVALKNFNECELIIINANSPGNEEPVIKEFMQRYPNIVYERLAADPGIYGVWNYAIKKARGEYLSNSNLDDRRNPDFLIEEIKMLDEHPEVDLAYADYLWTNIAHETFTKRVNNIVSQAHDFTPPQMYLCLPGPHPLWRKSMHEKYGYFREDFKVVGDHEFWNRAVAKGAQFKKVPGISGVYYENPKSLSNNPQKQAQKDFESSILRGAYKYRWDLAPDQGPLLLIKIPTRSRPEKFFKQLDNYYKNLSGKVCYWFLISCDADDTTMNNDGIKERFKYYPNLTVTFSNNASKVEAYNRDLATTSFDIVVLGSDDMEPVKWGYDKDIADAFAKNFPDYDGVLNYNDGHVGAVCNTYPVVGKNFYKRYGYVYHPAYASLFANDELTVLSRMHGKELVSDDVLLRHNHPAWGLGDWDALYQRNEGLKDRDHVIFKFHRLNNFNINARPPSKMWSILILTIEERFEIFKKLYEKLMTQIVSAGLQDQVEVLYYKDKRGEHKIGTKRNALLQNSQGKYVCFIDDDDDVHPQYITMMHEQMKKDPDCIRLVGIMTTHGQNPQKFIHSLAYGDRWSWENGAYIRPPNHLNPIRRSIAIQFPFNEINFGEDKDWSLAIARSGLIKTEASPSSTDEPFYFYQYDGKYQGAAPQKQEPTTVAAGAAVQPEAQIAADDLLYIVTASDAKYYDSLHYMIGSLHATNYERLGVIGVANLGMTPEQIKELEKIDKVFVFEVEKIHPDIIASVNVNNSGKHVPGWYAWKPVIIKQMLEKYPHVFYMDATTIVFKPLDDLIQYVKEHDYFVCTIGDDGVPEKHTVGWGTTKRVIDAFDLTAGDKKWVLDQEPLLTGFYGVTRKGSAAFVDRMYELSKTMDLYIDDGTGPHGFGTGRHDQIVMSVLGYLQQLRIFTCDHKQEEPMLLDVHGKLVPLHITWHGENEKTTIFSARGSAKSYGTFLNAIHYKKV